MGILRLFKSLFAQFVSGEAVFFAVGDGCGSVGMGCQVVEFR
jgi:hypothetical protein